MFETITRDWCVLVIVPVEGGKSGISVFGPYTYAEATNVIIPVIKAGAVSGAQVIGSALKIYDVTAPIVLA